jgi:type I restriction enzyme S subunit
MGKAAIAAEDCATNQQINALIVESTDDPMYVYYDLSRSKEEIRRVASGSAQPYLNKTAFGKLEIALPPPCKQRAIAAILGALDDKIELNRRMNETLEAIAQAVFKSWFVDFDPVHAKAEGRRPYGMDAETAALFPDSFEDSELGEIPYAWHVGTLSSVSRNRREILDPSSIDETTPYIGLEHMPRRSIALPDWGHSGDVGSAKSRFGAGQILFGSRLSMAFAPQTYSLWTATQKNGSPFVSVI